MNIYEEIVKLQRAGRCGAVATIVNSRGSIPSFQSAKMLVRDDGSIAGTIGGGCVEAEVWQAAREVIAQEKPRTLSFDLNQDPKYDTGLVCGGTLEIFIEPVLPVPLLYSLAPATSPSNSTKPRGTPASIASSPTTATPTPTPSASPARLKSSPKTSTKRSRRYAPANPPTSSSVPAATATTCAFCAGPCKPPRATSA